MWSIEAAPTNPHKFNQMTIVILLSMFIKRIMTSKDHVVVAFIAALCIMMPMAFGNKTSLIYDEHDIHKSLILRLETVGLRHVPTLPSAVVISLGSSTVNLMGCKQGFRQPQKM